ncbi:MAG: hypothetical protein ACRCZF_27015, partial [Gemmataceae bacterium]
IKGGRASGTKVTTPGGETFAKGSAGGVNKSADGSVKAGAAAGAAVKGPEGTSAIGRRGGVAIDSTGAITGKSTSSRSMNTGSIGPVPTASGRTVYRGSAGHGTYYYGSSHLHTTGVAVRSVPHAYFNTSWYTAHRTAWVAPRWTTPVWVAPVWPTVTTFVGVTTPPVAYDYGDNVVIQNNTVYMNGDATASATDYAQQATTIVETGRQAKLAETEDWQSLGVFGLVQGQETVAQRIFQLGINKQGIVRGNYYDAIADNTMTVVGALDTKTQRVAWSVGDKKDVVFEAGLQNLTQPETAVLVHYGKESTQQMLLVRLEEPVAAPSMK